MKRDWVRTGMTLERETFTALTIKAKSMGITRHRLCTDAIKGILIEKTSDSLQEGV